MMRLFLPLCFCVAWALGIFLARSLATADPATQPATGRAGAAVAVAGEMPPDSVEKATDALGGWGCLLVQSASRWDVLQQKLAGLGWQKPADVALAKVDFGRQAVVCVFDCGDEGNAFSLHHFSGDAKACHVDVVMSYIIYKTRDRVVNKCKFLLVAVPKSDALKVTVSTYHPYNGGPNPTPDKARLEWSDTFGPSSGDVVAGLRGVIEPEARAVKAGEDVRVRFTLESAADTIVEPGHFARKIDVLYVWDGKYSNGYRNHGFQVEMPGHTVGLLRPKQIRAWDKNVPHLEPIEPNHPYVLPEWQEGKTFKSLKALGLDTSKPGAYAVTGIYGEKGEVAKEGNQPQPLWGGELWTNTVTVEVKLGN